LFILPSHHHTHAARLRLRVTFYTPHIYPLPLHAGCCCLTRAVPTLRLRTTPLPLHHGLRVDLRLRLPRLVYLCGVLILYRAHTPHLHRALHTHTRRLRTYDHTRFARAHGCEHTFTFPFTHVCTGYAHAHTLLLRLPLRCGTVHYHTHVTHIPFTRFTHTHIVVICSCDLHLIWLDDLVDLYGWIWDTLVDLEEKRTLYSYICWPLTLYLVFGTTLFTHVVHIQFTCLDCPFVYLPAVATHWLHLYTHLHCYCTHTLYTTDLLPQFAWFAFYTHLHTRYAHVTFGYTYGCYIYLSRLRFCGH